MNRDIIAIGGSTGALDGMKQLCAGLPQGLPASLFFAWHIGLDGRNFIADILDAAGPLTAVTAVDGQPIENGHIYVAPVDHHLLVIDDVIRLGRGPRENLMRPAIDPLMRSVGVSYGSRAIGVVLSGQLHDGAAGLSDLKRCGGLTVVQDPAGAVAADMPLSALEASEIDHCVAMGDMAALLMTLVGEAAGMSPSPSREIALEVDIALGRPCLSATIAQFADPVPLSCPACSGVMSQVRTKPLRFRCQVGHAYSAQALAGNHSDSVVEAIGIALRIVEERAVLSEKIAYDARSSERNHAAVGFEIKAKELRHYADILRKAALGP